MNISESANPFCRMEIIPSNRSVRIQTNKSCFFALVVSIFFGIAFGLYRESLVTGITALASFSLLFAPLTSLACFTMPLSHTAKRLNKYGSVISGVKTARKLEEANACGT